MRYQSRGPRRRWMRPRGPKVCQFYADKLPTLTYKQVDVLKNFITSQGKIMPRRQTGCSAKNQRKITQIIKQARHMALLPFVAGENQN